MRSNVSVMSQGMGLPHSPRPAAGICRMLRGGSCQEHRKSGSHRRPSRCVPHACALSPAWPAGQAEAPVRTRREAPRGVRCQARPCLGHAACPWPRVARRGADLPGFRERPRMTGRPWRRACGFLAVVSVTRVSALGGGDVAGPGVILDFIKWGVAWAYGGRSGLEELAAEPGDHVSDGGFGLGAVPRAQEAGW